MTVLEQNTFIRICDKCGLTNEAEQAFDGQYVWQACLMTSVGGGLELVNYERI